MSDLVTLEWPREGVALITMTNPDIKNHGSWEAIEQVGEYLTQARNEGARISVLASGIDGHWFEHAWLRDLRNGVIGEPTTSKGKGAGWGTCLQELACEPVITIAAINGDTSGGGCELGWACDLRIADEQARFAQPEVQIALTTGIGGTSRLARIVGRTAAAEIVLDGRYVSAERIYQLGGVNRVVPNGTCTEVALEWADRLAERPAHALATLKRILISNDEHLNLPDALTSEQKLFGTTVSTQEAIDTMGEIQDRFDQGVSPAEEYGVQ